jgi:hypothetical protein
MNTLDNNLIHHVLSARLFATQTGNGSDIIQQREAEHGYSKHTGKGEVSGMWKRECEIKAVARHHPRMAGQDSASLDG